ncbi:MAG: (d)CMP kinase [Pseudomonadota bacterium]
MIIAVDGPAASGKGTLSKRLAQNYGLAYLDTGALYRAVARDVQAVGGDLEDAALCVRKAKELDAASLEDPFLREKGVGEAASIAARHGEVRAALLDYQRSFASAPGGAVLDGRDIGTVVCPDAHVKLFVTAEPEERARRRFHQWQSQGFDVTFQDILDEIHNRDARDRERTASPLVQAADAHLLETSQLDIEAAYKAAVDIVEGAMRR